MAGRTPDPFTSPEPRLGINLGPRTKSRLVEVGIATEAELRAVGAVAAWRRLRHAFPRAVSLNALWALHGALAGIPWTALDDATKARLRAEAGIGDAARGKARRSAERG